LQITDLAKHWMNWWRAPTRPCTRPKKPAETVSYVRTQA